MDKKQVLIGNTTGVYDMNGGANEKVAAYVNNGDDSLTENGINLINAEAMHKDIYTEGPGDRQNENYAKTRSKYGDAVYETSSGNGIGEEAWYHARTRMPYTDFPFFSRGGQNSYGGIFAFLVDNGSSFYSDGSRVVIPVL